MNSDTNVKKVHTNAKNLKWYNWVLVIFQTSILAFFIYLILSMIVEADSILDANNGFQTVVTVAAGAIVFFHIWKRSAYSMLKSRLTLTYNDTEIVSFQTAVACFHTPLFLIDIKNVVRKSPVSIEMVFNRPVSYDNIFFVFSKYPAPPLEATLLYGHEKELDIFCEDLKKVGVNTTADNTLYEDPQKFKAIVIIVFTVFFLIFMAVIWFAPSSGNI